MLCHAMSAISALMALHHLALGLQALRLCDINLI